MPKSHLMACGLVVLGACGPGGPSRGDDESIADDDESSSTEVPADLLDPGHVLEIEEVPAELQTIAAGAIEAFEGSEVPRRCPHPNGAPFGGEASFTPDVGTDCNVGPEGRCVPAMGGGGAGYYDSALWTDNSVWAGIGFAKTEPHCFHYNFIATNDMQGTGSCSFTARAIADLDADATFSTYELRGSVDENGSILQPLFIDLPYE
jgi:hypothetical protein